VKLQFLDAVFSGVLGSAQWAKGCTQYSKTLYFGAMTSNLA